MSNTKRAKRAIERAAKLGRPLDPKEIAELYAHEPKPKFLGGTPLERRIQTRTVVAKSSKSEKRRR